MKNDLHHCYFANWAINLKYNYIKECDPVYFWMKRRALRQMNMGC